MTAYYNENDPKAAAWLRELIRNDLIAPGDVDEHSIEDVTPDDLRGYTQCHFFAGIGVWSYSLRSSGWPDDRPVWTGSCPCQPFSAAGKRGGVADERHLWPSWFHLIDEHRPTVILGEQVASKDGLGWLDLVQADMEGTGYAVGAVDTCAAGFGAPHIRQRLWWVAERLADADDERSQGRPFPTERAGERLAGPNGVASGLEHASGNGRQQRRPEPSGWSAAGGCGDVGLADSNGRDASTEGLQRSGQYGQQEDASACRFCDGSGWFYSDPDLGPCDCRPGSTNGLWSDADWLFCCDGKWRPVEPGTFPLAHGAPARVGLLRGFGNAIVAPAAQAFIEAYLETEADRRLQLTGVSEMTNDKGIFS